MNNQKIAEIFDNMAMLLEISDDNVFKIRAYRRAAEVLYGLGEDVAHLKEHRKLSSLSGIGKALEEKIDEYLTDGRIRAYEDLKKEVPESLLELTAIPSLGPKKTKVLFKELKITNINELEQNIKKGALFQLPGFGEKAVENIAKGIRVVRQGLERMDLAKAEQVAGYFCGALKKNKAVKQVTVAGSLRRQKEAIRDIDILVDSTQPARVMDALVQLSEVHHVIVRGETKTSVATKENIQVDVRVVSPKEFGAALLYFTGSKYFNIRLRQRAIKNNMKINEYGLFSVRGQKEKFLCGKTENKMFKKLGMPYVPPELREDIGSGDLFALKKTPVLVKQENIKGDLHVHSTWSDGLDSIAALAEAAQKQKYRYLAISDHSKRLQIAGGLSVQELKEKKKEIERLNKKFKNFCILFGTEVEIDAEGHIDYNEETLREFDVVIGAIHSGFEQGRAQLTRRLVNACQNKYVHVIAHPFGVHAGKREAYDIDFEEVCRAAYDTQTALEINAFPIRLDLDAAHAHYARKFKVKFCVNTDAHKKEQLAFMRYGISVARRAWLQKEDIINTLPLAALKKFLNQKRKHA